LHMSFAEEVLLTECLTVHAKFLLIVQERLCRARAL